MRPSTQWTRFALTSTLLFGLACGNDGAPVTEQVAPLSLTEALVDAPTTPPEAPTTVPEANFTLLEGGLKFHDLVVGTGEAPVRGSKVTVHYTGWLTDGTQFDSSLNRPGPFDFRLETGSVIKGWHLGVAGMKVGGSRQLVIPPDLAYGSQKKGKIPPESTLVFEIQLLDVGDVRVPPAVMPTATQWENAKSGLQTYELVAGDGEGVIEGSVITAEITLWLETGDLVFSTYQAERGIPFIQGAKTVMPGWDLGALGMNAGGSRLLRIPSELAFGEQGRGKIKPNATVITQIDILEVGPPRIPPESMPKFKKNKLKTTESGLQFLDLVEGHGATPQAGQTVIVEYSGWLENGTLFDSSYKQPKSFEFPVGKGRVIKGWDEGVGSMQIGGTRILRIPPELAYGERGSPPVIPASSTLVFQVELKGAK